MEESAIPNARAEMNGVPASEGLAIGPVYVHDPGEARPQRQSIDSGEAEPELQRFSRAVQAVVFAAMDDEYMAARADDVRDVVAQISAEITADLTGSRVVSGLASLVEPSIILARSLAPSDTARIPAGMALGFVTAEGSLTSHVSIMARSLGVPAIVGTGESLLRYLQTRPTTVALDGGAGRAVADPGPEILHEFEVR